MFMDYSTFLKSLRVAFSRQWIAPKRIFWIFLYLICILIVYSINIVGWIIDELFFSGYHAVIIKKPVIIVANPRSGTTFLHRLMCMDTENFASLKLYQTIFPSVSLIKFFQILGFFDKKIGSPLGKIVSWFEKKIFAGWKNIHPIGFTKAEEDEALFLFPFATPALLMIFPFFQELNTLRFADNLTDTKRRALEKYYRNCIKRFIYATNSESQIFLLKSVLFNGRMKIISDVFPDARIVYLIRNPYEVIPSIISMFTSFWKVASPDLLTDNKYYQLWAQLAVDYYRYFHENRHMLDKDNMIIVPYKSLTADPYEVIKDIYIKFNIRISETISEKLMSEINSQKNYKSKHKYSLQEYGISRDMIYSQLKEIYDEYGFER